MEYEVFKGKKTYYVMPQMATFTDRLIARNEMARILKVKREKLILIPVWIQRCTWDEEKRDYRHLLWLESMPDTEEMMAVVRK